MGIFMSNQDQHDEWERGRAPYRARSALVRGHFQIQGRVQGVCFRMCCRDEAVALGLTGWVQNRADGSVEVMAEGAEQAVIALVLWCRSGPPGARVMELKDTWHEAEGCFGCFEIRG